MTISFCNTVENTVGKGENAGKCKTKTKSVLLSVKVSPLQNDKFLEVTKLNTFTGDKLNIAKMTISFCNTVENTVGKGENAGYQHFLLFPQCFPITFSFGSSKVGIVW